MKRYFTMSLSLFLYSIIYSVTFLLLGIVSGNSSYAEIYSITYPLQYIAFLIGAMFGTASYIRTNKEKNDDCDETGMVLSVVTGVILFGIVAIFIDKYLSFMNVDPGFYRTYSLMMVGQMFFILVNNITVEKLFFEDRDKLGNLCSIFFTVTNLVSIIVPALITKNQIIIASINFGLLLIYCTVWFFVAIHKFRFSFNLFRNIKYESMNIIGEIFMFLIYLFGYRVAFSYGAEYVIALNFVSLVTDPQWDALTCLTTIAKIDLSKGEYNYKRSLKNSAAVVGFYCLTSIVLFFALFKLYKVSLGLGLLFLGAQIVDMVLDIFNTNLKCFMQLEYSSAKSTAFTSFAKVIRVLMSILILNPFNTSIGQLTDDILVLIFFIIIRFNRFKLQPDGTLNPKSMIRKTKIKIDDN